MRKIWLILLFFPGLCELAAQTPRILFVLPDRFGLNTYLYREKMIEYGWDLEVTGMTSEVSPCPWSTGLGNKPIPVDILIDSIQDILNYDAVVIATMNWRIDPAGAYADLTGSSHFLGLIQQATAAGIPVMTSCAGTLVLAAADVINGIDVQGTPGPDSLFVTQYLAAGANYLGSQLPPVTDGIIITTSRGQYFMKQNCDAMLTAIAKNR